MTKFIFLFLIMSLNSYAHKPKMLILDPDISDDEFKNDFVLEKPSKRMLLHDRLKREEILDGIKGASSWDELQRDLFIIDLGNKNDQEIRKKYPDISKEDLLKIRKRFK